MKKSAIKKAVERATAKHVPHAIKAVARSRAFGQVYNALHASPGTDVPVAQAAKEVPGDTVTNAFPSAPSRGGAPIANTPAAAMASAMTSRRR